jgi:hypothetical protein
MTARQAARWLGAVVLSLVALLCAGTIVAEVVNLATGNHGTIHPAKYTVVLLLELFLAWLAFEGARRLFWSARNDR